MASGRVIARLPQPRAGLLRARAPPQPQAPADDGSGTAPLGAAGAHPPPRSSSSSAAQSWKAPGSAASDRRPDLKRPAPAMGDENSYSGSRASRRSDRSEDAYERPAKFRAVDVQRTRVPGDRAGAPAAGAIPRRADMDVDVRDDRDDRRKRPALGHHAVTVPKPQPARVRRQRIAHDRDAAPERVEPLIRQPALEHRFSSLTALGPMVELDPLMVSEYADDIYSYWRSLELKLLPDPGYMHRQPELSWDMRATLVNWMVQVHGRFKLLPETLFLSVGLLDRFLSTRPVILSKFQLVGISALFIACKFEEIYFPSINDFVFACDGIYTVDEIRRAERYMLGGLNWEIGSAGPLNFLRRLNRADNHDARIRVLGKYLLEATIVDPRFLAVQPSAMVAASVWLARKMIHWEEARQRRASGASSNGNGAGRESSSVEIEWTPLHYNLSGQYTEPELIPLAQAILDCASKPQNHAAVFEKYADQAQYFGVSDFVRRWCLSNGFAN
ncbi:cyclin-like protein [Hyaloraphidium curvatum]|nr:cyclin-like protein [Hyaloraphidium curvatum]